MGRIAVTGSVAFDNIMVFPGRFGEHILPDRTHDINVSFLVDQLERRRGGNAANIAYTLALLGEVPLLAAAVGNDFAAFGEVLAGAGVDISAALYCDDIATATCFITTDLDNNQITAFFPGAMGRAAGIDLRTLAGLSHVVVSPDAPDAMASHIAEAVEMRVKLLFVPAQQLPAMGEATLRAGIDAAWLIAGNDYEFELIRSRTGRSVADLCAAGTVVCVTTGHEGSAIHTMDGIEHIPVAPPGNVVDPTGAGDAYVAGVLAGVRRGLPWPDAGRMGALAATYVIEQNGTQSHHFTAAEFHIRYRAAFNAELATPG